MKHIPALFFLVFSSVQAQEQAELPEKARKLQQSYQAAAERAIAPLRATYIKELEKLKAEYTRAGDLKGAVSVDTLIQDAGVSAGGDKAMRLADMSERQFKRWLGDVKIVELESPYLNEYSYENEVLTTMRPGLTSPRSHPTGTVEPGKLFVPFTNMSATIIIAPDLTKAVVQYNTGTRYEARIVPKK